MRPSSHAPQAFLVSGVRTPIGRYGGALSSIRPDDLAAHVVMQLMRRCPLIPAEAIDDLLIGCANQAGEDNRNVARMAALLAGLQGVTGATINRLCGSGLDAVGQAARAIRTGEAEIIIAGGVESMSRAPFVMAKATEAFSRQAEMFDSTIGWRFVNPRMQPAFGIDSMPETAENVAAEFGISRTPLREALKVLATEGLVTMKVRRGAYVTEVSREDVAQVDRQPGHSRGGHLRQVLERLHGPVLRRAGRAMHDEGALLHVEHSWGWTARLKSELCKPLCDCLRIAFGSF
jgi:hypothetical protein